MAVGEMKNFGIRLKKLREERGLTVEMLANELKLTDFSILMWEKDKRVFNLKVLIKLAKYFNVSIDYLLGL